MSRWIACAAVALLAAPARPFTGDRIAPNDNRTSVGTLANGVLTAAIEARHGVWHPEGDGGRGVDIAAFADEGKTPTNPGPLIRVPVGTTVRLTIRNRLDQPLTVAGLGARGLFDTVTVPVNGVTPVSFTATTPGTYYYIGRTGTVPVLRFPDRRLAAAFDARFPTDQGLSGIIIVDPPNARPDPAERIFAISWWFALDPESPTGIKSVVMTLNGQSWPHTERLRYTQGDSVHWRVVNFTPIGHPMHLHGFYFRVDGKGSGVADSLYSADQRRMAVTEVVGPFQTMELAWKADRPGNWVYHCHFAAHVSEIVSLDADHGTLDSTMMGHHMSDRPHQMFGLVMGLSVAPNGSPVAATGPERKIRILQREKPNVYGSQPGMSFVVDGTPEASNPDALSIPGPALVLERGKRVAVTVVNQSNDHASVHWHGIELESYPDGVPGWSGSGTNVLPSIAPHDSLTVRWTPPRAGSFMYHSHFREMQQMASGLYGPIIVLEAGQKFDPETDRILFFGTGGTTPNLIDGPFPPFLMNGKAQPDAMSLEAGTRYRFRLFNLAGDRPLQVSITAGDAPTEWRAVAKDGYPLPPSQATVRPAVLVFAPGEIYDFELTPSAPGDLTLTFGMPAFLIPPPPPPGAPPGPRFHPLPPISVPVHVR
jgi:FtsP/CotA-like multicopper oxidase with cupredoxin domain